MRESGPNFQFDAPESVVQVDTGALEVGGRLHHTPPRAQPVKDIPGELGASDPSVSDDRKILADHGVVSIVASIALQTWQVTGFGADDVFLAESLSLAEAFELGPAVNGGADGLRQIDPERLVIQLACQLQRDVLKRRPGQVHA